MNAPPESLLQETEQFVRQPHGFDQYRAGLQTYRSWANEHFEREETRLFIGGWACHVSMGPDDAGGGHMASLFASLLQDVGNPLMRLDNGLGLSLPLQGRRPHPLCRRHGAGGAEDRSERRLASRRLFARRLTNGSD
jgi:hypothetical protein